jgi:hypothetical protein
MSAAHPTWLRRSLRRFLLGAGPLKRRSDRAQMVGRLVVVLSFLVAPLLAVVAATATTTHLEAAAAEQAADRYRSSAVLLEDAPTASTGAGYDDGFSSVVPVHAAWPLPNGTTRDDVVLTKAGTPAGTAVPVWLDADGNRTVAPLDRAGIPGTALTVAALPLLGLPTVTWTLYAVLCSTLDSSRERRWGQEWVTVEREWGRPLS